MSEPTYTIVDLSPAEAVAYELIPNISLYVIDGQTYRFVGLDGGKYLFRGVDLGAGVSELLLTSGVFLQKVADKTAANIAFSSEEI